MIFRNITVLNDIYTHDGSLPNIGYFFRIIVIRNALIIYT